MTYDPKLQLVVFFGGEYSLVGGDPEYFNDVWTYDGAQWVKVIIVGPSPTPRSWASFEPHAGFLRLGQGIGDHGIEADEWYLDLTSPTSGSWKPVPSIVTQDKDNAWLPRGFMEFGGVAMSLGDGFAIDSLHKASRFTELLPTSVADFAGIQFPDGHPFSSQPLLLGGGQFSAAGFTDDPGVPPGPLQELFFYKTRKWDTLGCTPRPQNRAQHTAAYDPIRKRVVLFGGAGIQSPEIYWELKLRGAPSQNCYEWQRLDWASNVPEGRAHAKMVYDEKRQVMVLFGGIGGPGFRRFGDTWELIPVPPDIYPTFTPNLEVCLGETFKLFSSVAAAPPYDIQWYVDDSPITFGNQPVLEQTPNYKTTLDYYYVVRDACDNVRTSATQRVTMYRKPELIGFTTEIVCPGSPIRLTGNVDSDSPVEVQWYKDGKPVGDSMTFQPGSHPVSLYIPSAQYSDSGYYILGGKNRCGSNKSLEIDFFGNPQGFLQVGPEIHQHPVSAVGKVCESVKFEAFAVGLGTVRYQWRLDGMSLTNDDRISGANSDQLVLRGLRHNQRGNYDVVAWDDCGRAYAVTSRVATLQIVPGPDWLIRTNLGPSSRYRHTMAYDSTRHVTVLFGGYYYPSNELTAFNDLWEWNGMRWTQRTTNTTSAWEVNPSTGGWRPAFREAPVGRGEHAMTYDPKRGRIVIFGGVAKDPSGFIHNLNDLWEWDGSQWSFRGTNGPGWRSSAAMAYDPRNQTVAMFGGVYDSAAPNPGAFWTWDGLQWKVVPTTGDVGRFANTISMVYDDFRGSFLYGPTYNPDGTFIDRFWSLKGTQWIAHPAAFYFGEIPATYGNLVYDSDRRRATYTFSVLGHTAIGDGALWETMTNNPTPAARFWHSCAYDSDRKVVVLFGGTFGFNRIYSSTNDTWELTYIDVPQIREHPTSQVQKPADTAVFSVNAIGFGALSYKWFRNGEPLSDGPRISGSATNQLRISNVASNDIALYQVQISNPCGTALSRPAYLTLNPNLQIVNSIGEITLVWSTSESILEQADAVSGPWTAVPGASNPFNPGLAAEFKLFRLRPVP